jgi:hypothetical protein
MRRRSSAAILQDVESLGQRIDLWRQQRQKKGSMPDRLWQQAVELAHTHGIYATARDLPVDYGTLRSKVERARQPSATTVDGELASTEGVPIEEEPAPPFHFVEVRAAERLEPGTAREVTVELVAPDGASLTIRQSGGSSFDVATVVESFRRRGA